jgi:DNA-binding NtrC family response regulator
LRTETHDDPAALAPAPAARHPALVVVRSVERPECLVLPLSSGAIEIGRDELAAAGIPDSRASRRHARVEADGDRWTVRDLGSRNGTFVDGRPVQSARNLAAPLIRIGRTLLLAVADRRPYETPGITVSGGAVMGPSLRAVHELVALCARSGDSVLIHGESGTGKERAAEAFHAAADRGARPFVAINCAAIQKELAEGVLFGARRGAYTGAVADTVGLVQAASGGTLFLDEIAELDPGVQAKLLRVLETKKVVPLGAVTPVPVTFRLCAASHKSLRAEVAAGRFREDLYFRIGRPEVRLPPLRERREEIPWLIEHALVAAKEATGGAPFTASPELVEAFMLRPWPGNVRELLAEVRMATLSARAAGRTSIAAADLDGAAGRPLDADPGRPPDVDAGRAPDAEPRRPPDVAGPPDVPPAPGGRRRPGDVRRAELDEALRASRWDLAKAASILGISRTSLYSLIAESPHLRTAGDLTPEEIRRVFGECRGDVGRMVERLEVSERALRRRLRDLGIDDRGEPDPE